MMSYSLQGCKDGSTYTISVTHHINTWWEKLHDYLKNAKKPLIKFNIPSLQKPWKNRLEKTYFNLMKDAYTSIVNSILSEKCSIPF